MKRFFTVSRGVSLAVLLSLSLLLAFLSPFVSSAGATSAYDSAIQTTPSLVLKNDACATGVDLSTTWSQWLGNNAYADAARAQISANGSHGGWYVNSYISGSETFANITVIKSETTNSTYTLGPNPDYPSQTQGMLVNNTSGSAIADGVTVWAFMIKQNPANCSQGALYAQGSGYNWYIGSNFVHNFLPTGSNKYFFLAVGDFIQPTGYSGAIPPQTYSTKTNVNPPISYVVNANHISANYTGKPCIQDPTDAGSCPPFRIYYSLIANSSPSTPIDTKTLEFNDTYTFDSTKNDTYTLVALYQAKPVPYANLPGAYNYVSTTLTFVVDGSSYKGDSTGCVVSGGLCSGGTVVNCSAISDFFASLSCKTANQFKTGLINPSINALKGLMTSVIVPDQPTCGFTIPNATISGQTFNTSSLGSQICNQTATVRNNFPILPVLVNFSLALGILYLIVRMINTLTNDKKNDIIVGVTR